MVTEKHIRPSKIKISVSEKPFKVKICHSVLDHCSKLGQIMQSHNENKTARVRKREHNRKILFYIQQPIVSLFENLNFDRNSMLQIGAAQ